MAAGGTLLPDEIGDLAPEAQAKIMRAIEEKTVERAGGRETIPIDVRIVACTNHDLDADTDKGLFRRDLYHRPNTVTISLSPLSERLEDIPLLVEHFLRTGEGPGVSISRGALDLLGEYHYPGNVRELRRIVERARLFARGLVIQPGDLPPEVHEGGAPAKRGGGAEEAGRSHKGLTRLFRIEDRYKRFVNFLQYHGLRVRR